MTIPYAVKEGGLLSLSLLLLFALICCYTGILLKRCLESYPGITSYPDIGQAAFGIIGRLGIAVSTIRLTSMVLNCSNSYGRSMILINFVKNCSQIRPYNCRIAVLAT
jgi:vesicular inhibitory amino acid transporter